MAVDSNVLPWHAPARAAVKRQTVQQLCRQLVDDADYRLQFKARLNAGKLPPMLEAMVWYYAHGKPVENVVLKTESELPEDASLEDLYSVMQGLQKKLDELNEIRAAIPAEYFVS